MRIDLKDEHTKKIVIFDTTFGWNNLTIEDGLGSHKGNTNLVDGINFYKDMLRLVRHKHMHWFAFKPSKSVRYYLNYGGGITGDKVKEMLALWKEISKEPNVWWVVSQEPTEESFLNFEYNIPLQVASDLVITHCMSSTTAEALSSRNKAFWYESGNNHVGIEYDKIPFLIAHGYDQLLDFVNNFLYVSESDYNLYIDKYIKGKVDSYCDGKAINRYKELLSKEN